MKSKKIKKFSPLLLVQDIFLAVVAHLQIWKQHILEGFSSSRNQYLVVLSLLVGVVAGVAAYVFHSLIKFFGRMTVGDIVHAGPFEITGKAYLLLFPALGGLLTGIIFLLLKPEYRLQGVPEVIHSLIRRSGIMKMRATFAKSCGAIFTMGTGGSAGPEGPVAELGAATGSLLGRLLSVPPQIMRMLVAGGAAGGIAASFHAPIGGVFFALEVLLAEFTTQAFSLVVLSTVTATWISRAFLGGEAYFSAPLYVLGPSWELFIFAGLGIVGGVVSKGYVRFLDRGTDLFTNLKRVPLWLRPAMGGLIVGAIALVTPQILGIGHGVIEDALWGRIPFYFLVALFFGKLLATSFTIGSGGVGGTFLPGFFIGAMMGGAFGVGMKFVFSHFGIALISQPGAFALVGMAALLAGSTRAPMTSIIIVSEITNDHHMILPVMIAVVLSTMVARAIEKRTIYTHHLSLRGIREKDPKSVRALESTTVQEVMTKKVGTVSPAMLLDRLARLVETRGHSGFPVVDDNNDLVGLVTFEEIRHALSEKDLPHDVIVAGDIMRSPAPTLYPDQTIGAALNSFNRLAVDRLAVVGRDNPKKVMGIITQSDVLRIYRKLLM